MTWHSEHLFDFFPLLPRYVYILLIISLKCFPSSIYKCSVPSSNILITTSMSIEHFFFWKPPRKYLSSITARRSLSVEG